MNRASSKYLANVIVLRSFRVAFITFVVCICHHVTVMTEAKVFERCELAQVLRYGHGVDLNDVANWVCIAQHSSSLNTSAFAGNAKIGSHGIFQISDEYWCSPPGKGVACGVSCARLRDDDISDDFECVRKIHDEHQGLSGDGFSAWNAYQLYCKENPYEYIEDCFGNEDREYIRSKYITTNYVRDEDNVSHEPHSRGKVYGRCELAKELFLKHKMPMDEIPTWVCIAQHESHYDTSAVGRLNADGSADHGLFQISDLFWCSQKDGQRKACGQPCSKFLDSDITDDVKCVKQIHKEHTRISGNGFNAWTVYNAHCHEATEKYIRGCFDGIDVEESKHSEQYNAYSKPSKGDAGGKPHGKVYQPCELAEDLRNKYHLPEDQIATWVCIAKHESGYNTSAIGYGDHGLFQISDIYWCSPPGKGWACGLSCADLEDSDISDDIACVRKIYDEHSHLSGDGFNAWTVYPRYCSNGRAEKYISNCPGHSETLRGAASFTTYSKPISSNSIEEYHPTGKGKIYGRCELANELLDKYHMPMEEIPTWVCIAHHESNFDTSAVGRLNADGSADHGLFQISDLFWCSDNGDEYGKACGLPCSKLLDSDISDDVECVKQIHDEHTRISGDGFSAWTVYNAYCKDHVEQYTRGCFDGSASVEDFEPIPRAIDVGYKPKNKPKGKVYEGCELAKELRDKHRIPEDQISSWVCIAKHQSGLNTSASSADSHGMFFISDEFWCSPPGKGKACELHCSDLEDSDITDDVQCVKKIYEEHQRIYGNGFNAWRVYDQHCSNGRADDFTNQCLGFESTARNSISYGAQDSQYKFGRSLEPNKPVFDHAFKANPFLKHVDVVQTNSAGNLSPFFSGIKSVNKYQDGLGESFGASEDDLSVNHQDYVRNPFLKYVQSATQKPTVKTTITTPSWKNAFLQSTTAPYQAFNNFNSKSTKPAVPVKSYAWSTPAPPTMSEERAKYEIYKTFTTPPPPAFTVTPKANRLQPYHLNTIKTFDTTITPFWLTTTTRSPTSWSSQNSVVATPFWLTTTTTTPKPTSRLQFYEWSTPKSLSWQSSTTTAKPPTSRLQFYESTSQKSVAATPFWLTTTTQKPTTRLQSSSNIPFWITSTTQKPTTRQQSSTNIPFWLTSTSQKPKTSLQSSSTIPFWLTSTTQKPTTSFRSSSSNIPFWLTSTTQKPTTSLQSSSSNIPFWLTSTTQKPTTRLPSSSNIPFWLTSTTQKPSTRQQSSTNIPFWLTSTTQKPTTSLQSSSPNIPFWLTSTTQKPTTRLQSSSNIPFWLTSTTQKPTTRQQSSTNIPFWLTSTTLKPTNSLQLSSNIPFWLTSTTQKPTTSLQSSSSNIPFWLTSTTTQKPTTRLSSISPFGAVPFWLASTSTLPPTSTSTTKAPASSKVIPLPFPSYQTSRIKTSTKLYASPTKAPSNSTSNNAGQYNAGQYSSGNYNAGKYEAPKPSSTTTTKLPSTTRTTIPKTKSPWNSRLVSSTTSKTTKYDPFRQFPPTTLKPKRTTAAYSNKSESPKSANLGVYVPYKAPTTVKSSSTKTPTTNIWNAWSTSKTTAKTTSLPPTKPTTKSTIKPSVTGSYAFSTLPKWTTSKPYTFSTTIKPSVKTNTTKPTQKFSFQYTTPQTKVTSSTSRSISNSTTPRPYVVPTKTQVQKSTTLQTKIPPWAITTTTEPPITTVINPTNSKTTPSSTSNIYDFYLKLYGIQLPSGTKTAS